MKITAEKCKLTKNSRPCDILSVTFGGEPEFFVADPKGDILNSDRFFPSKSEPLYVKVNDPSGKIYSNGIGAAVKFPRSVCRETVGYYIFETLAKAKSQIDENRIILEPAVKVKKTTIDKTILEDDVFKYADDFNAYTDGINTVPINAPKNLYRYADGCILIETSVYGEDKPLFKDPKNHLTFIKAMDLVVSLPLLALDNGPGSSLRRAKYGKAGRFKATRYGLEYKTPSCWWVRSPMTAALIYGLARVGWSLAAAGLYEVLLKAAEVEEADVRGIVDEGDLKAAEIVWKKIRPYIVTMGTPHNNPVHYMSIVPFPHSSLYLGRYVFNLPEMTTLANSESIDKKDGGPVASNPMILAVVEYMRKNGIDSIIEDFNTEWGLNTGQSLHLNGMMIGTHLKLKGPTKDFEYLALPATTRRDFFKFQKSLFNELY